MSLEIVDNKADKKVPSASGNIATLDKDGNLQDGGRNLSKLKPIIGNLTSDEGTEYYVAAYLEYVDGKLRLMNYATEQLVSEVDLGINNAVSYNGYPYKIEWVRPDPTKEYYNKITCFRLIGVSPSDYPNLTLSLMRNIKRRRRGGNGKPEGGENSIGWRHPIHLQEYGNEGEFALFRTSEGALYPRITEWPVSGEIMEINVPETLIYPWVFKNIVGHFNNSTLGDNVSYPIRGFGLALFRKKGEHEYEQVSDILRLKLGLSMGINNKTVNLLNFNLFTD